MNDYTKTVDADPVLGAALVGLVRAGRITKDLFLETMSSPDLAKKVIRHETMHDIMAIAYNINLRR